MEVATVQLPPGTWVRANLGERFAVDTVVLDIDGVLIDVGASFRETIRRVVADLQRIHGVGRPWVPSFADIVLLKRAGGFNDDVDASVALTAIGTGGRGADLADLAGAVEQAGGGLPALRLVAPDLPRIDGALTLRLFNAHYWGGADGESAGLGKDAPGLIEQEQPLVTANFVGRLRALGVEHVALVTGRTPRELRAAYALLAWDPDDIDVVVTGDMVRKPDPRCLDAVVDACGARRAVMVGDVRDDWELVRRYRAERDTTTQVRGVLVGDDGEMARHREFGVDATLRGVSDLPVLLKHWGRDGGDVTGE